MTDSGAGQPAGWYYAAGDPPGTQRYWDGTQWQGAPQPVGGGGAASTDGAATGLKSSTEYGPRFIGFLIDWGILIGLYIALIIVVAILSAISDTLGGLVLFLGWLGILGFSIYNYIYLQGTEGQTIGKKQQNTRLISDETGQPVGIGMAVARYFLGGFLGSICLLDYIWIFIDEENRRLSDKILTMRVVQE